jgi:hypothetical protein
MWLIARGAMADVAARQKPTVKHRFYHVPRVEHAVGHMILENNNDKPVRIALAGPGAFGIKHLDALKLIDGVEITSIIGRELPRRRKSPRSTARSTSPPTWTKRWPAPTWTP